MTKQLIKKEKLIKEILAINRENIQYDMSRELLLGTIDHYWENGLKALKDMDIQELKQILKEVKQ